jgi:hypothetical protein
MIPFQVNGIVEQFHCSECGRAIILEEPFFYSDPAQRAEGARKVKQWYSANCSQFPKVGIEIHPEVFIAPGVLLPAVDYTLGSSHCPG